MTRRFPFLLLFLFVSLNPGASFADEKPIEVRGDTVEYFHEEGKVVGVGHVSIDYEDVRLTADKITAYLNIKQAVAEGNVVLNQPGTVMKGEQATYDFAKKSGQVSNLTAQIQPTYFGKAETVERVAENHYRFSDAYVTTCCSDAPFYKIQARQVDIYPQNKVVIRNALLVVRGVPILFIPYYVQPYMDFDRFPVQIVPGKNSQWGAFILSKWRYHLIDSPALASKGNVLVDYREKRGWGTGFENFYRSEALGRGALRLYYADDDNPPLDADNDRYRVQWRHQMKLTKNTTLTAEHNKLSDRDLIKDFFFREEYEREVFPDNYLSIITAKPEYTLSILDRERVNDFQTVVERSPEIRFDTRNRGFADTPFYWRSEHQFSNLKKEFADSGSQLDLVRHDTNHTLTYAGRIGDLAVTPHIGTRQTIYSRDARGDEAQVRGIFDGGVDLSTHFFRTYDFSTRAWGLDWNRIRHVFAPSASYHFRPNPTVSRTTLQEFDALDALDKQHFIRFSLDNKFQTKEHGADGSLQTREITRVIPFFDMDYHQDRIQNVGLDVEFRPYSWMGIESDVVYDTDIDAVTTANADFYFDRNNVRFGLGQRYIRESSSQTTAQVRWTVNQDLAVTVYERYEFHESRQKEFEIVLSKTLDCAVMDLTYNHREGENSFYVAFRLKGFTKSSYDLNQSYNRPKLSPRSSSLRS